MVVGVLQAELAIFGAASLKDKRRVVRSIKDRIGHKYNVSIAEVADHDFCQKATLGIAMVSNEREYIESCLSKIVDQLRWVRDASLIDYWIEWY